MSMWHHFTDAADALTDFEKAGVVPFGMDMARMLEKWPKFYIPEAGDLSKGRSFADLLPIMRLPFPGIVTLRETKFNGDNGETTRGKVVTAFFEIDEIAIAGISAWQIWRELIPKEFNHPVWGAFSLGYSVSTGWTPFPPGLFLIEATGPGVQIRVLETKEMRSIVLPHLTMSQVEDELSDDATALAETCMLLNCNNVETVSVPAPKLVNKKRTSKGKRPLYEYHVLRVDGEIWDSPSATTRDGSGVRSHFRRGHFRRLDETRMTWVRATMVKGSVPGFVDKDYDVQPRALA